MCRLALSGWHTVGWNYLLKTTGERETEWCICWPQNQNNKLKGTKIAEQGGNFSVGHYD